jgi:hypothetical protein
MEYGATDYPRAPISASALSRSTRLVRAYANSIDGVVMAEVAAILDEVGEDKAALHDLVGSLAGLAGHAVRAMAIRLEADLGLEDQSGRPLPRLSEQRSKVLEECSDALLEGAAKRERRSGLDRRLAPDRRRLAPGDPREQINLRLFGERRVGPADRRSGSERRRFAADVRQSRPPFDAAIDARDAGLLAEPPVARANVRRLPRPRP